MTHLPPGGRSDTTITARGLVKRYGDVTALDGLDLDVAGGTVLGVLGPNGAGKTTAVSILATLCVPDSGTASVAGADVLADPGSVRQRIGLSGQYAAVDEYLTATENLEMIGCLYGMPRRAARRRAGELLESFRLTEAAHRPLKTFSGGMRRRIDLAGALVADPPVLFLDEPTTGLDPRSRGELWETIRERVSQGTTVLLTTQYLDEADRLADRILVIDHGRAIAQGTPEELKRRAGADHLHVHVTDRTQLDAAAGIIARVVSGAARTDAEEGEISVPVSDGVGALSAVLRALESAGVAVADVSLRRPSLDDVFMQLTGHGAEEGDAP